MSIEQILEEIVEICKNHGATEVWLYGSYAKGTQSRASDIDIAVDRANRYKLKIDLNTNIRTLKTINPALIPKEDNLFKREILNGRKLFD